MNKCDRINKQLACASCRRKKVKCFPPEDGGERCALCQKNNLECHVPQFDERRRHVSRELVRSLYARIADLEAELQEHRTCCISSNVAEESVSIEHFESSSHDSETAESPASLSATTASSEQNQCDSMIARLCGGRRQLNSDRAGRLRFFGPTSSLHLTESIVSSVLIHESRGANQNLRWQHDFSAEVQDYLMNLYWTYQHSVMPCIHKSAFLKDMEQGATRYCSKLLVYCILTRAAAICDRPWLRSLALSEDADDEAPYLVRKCTQLLEPELDDPNITTAQALQLLSEMYCANCHDTKAWMYGGGAGRLAYELGLHSDMADFDPSLSDLDKEVRQIVFWSAFNLDRAWALYLGRPHSMQIDDISVKRLDCNSDTVSWDGRMSAAWSGLFEVVGGICDMLNGQRISTCSTKTLDAALNTWYTSLETSLPYYPMQTPAVILLYMQYSSARILLHRSQARFGRPREAPDPARDASRQTCIENACSISNYLQDYSQSYGSVSTMSWVALHMIATATTTLIAAIVEVQDGIDPVPLLSSLKVCLAALGELEKSHIVTRRVKKVIQQAMRLLHLDTELQADWSLANASWTGNSQTFTPMVDDPKVPTTVTLLNSLPTGGQFDMLHSFNSYFT